MGAFSASALARLRSACRRACCPLMNSGARHPDPEATAMPPWSRATVASRSSSTPVSFREIQGEQAAESERESEAEQTQSLAQRPNGVWSVRGRFEAPVDVPKASNHLREPPENGPTNSKAAETHQVPIPQPSTYRQRRAASLHSAPRHFVLGGACPEAETFVMHPRLRPHRKNPPHGHKRLKPRPRSRPRNNPLKYHPS